MLRIVMDTAGDLPTGWAKKYAIDLIPINIIHKGKSYLQGFNVSYEDFYNWVEKDHDIPSTSQPTPYQFIKFYRKIAKPGDTILSIHITDKLSGTMSSARQAAEELKDEFTIIPFDSASGTVSMGMMCKEARVMERKGTNIDKILKRLDSIRRRMELVFTVDTLKYARMSGRVKYLQAALASLLNIKPIIELKNGIIEMRGRARSRSKSIELLLNKMKKKMGNQQINIAVVHARDSKTGEKVLEEVKKRFNCAEATLTELTISLAAHFGPRTIGIVAYPTLG